MMQNNPIIGRYARILLDDWFKRSFGQENSKRLLQLFLEALIPEHRIVELTYANTEGKKDVRIDVECTDADGTRFVVEVQVADQFHFYERAVFNSSFAILQQKAKGELNYDFPTVYFIGIMDFSYHVGSDQVDFRYTIREKRTNELMTQRVQYIFLELPNSLQKGLKPGATVLENICYALHQMEHLTEQPAELKQEIFKLLFESAEIATFTPEERVKYQNDMTTERDRYNQLVFAEAKGREQGREEGREEGRVGAIRKMVEQMRLRGISEAEIEAIVRSAQD